jgi:hypothetical protein
MVTLEAKHRAAIALFLSGLIEMLTADNTTCPVCGHELQVILGIDNMNEVFECPDCGASLMVEWDAYIDDEFDEDVMLFRFEEWWEHA